LREGYIIDNQESGSHQDYRCDILTMLPKVILYPGDEEVLT
jgi:hypothetical protein